MRIVKRALELLAVGGRLVYSTCSLNPLEDEAVMHRILVEAKGNFHCPYITIKILRTLFKLILCKEERTISEELMKCIV